MSSSGLFASRGMFATPMLTAHRWPRESTFAKAASMSRRSPSARRNAASTVSLGATSANSSPPIRPSVQPSRFAARDSSPVAALIARSPASRPWTVLSWCRLSMSSRSRVTWCSGLSRDSFQIAVSAPLKAGPVSKPSLSARIRTFLICAALGIAPPPTVLLTTYICVTDIGQGSRSDRSAAETFYPAAETRTLLAEAFEGLSTPSCRKKHE